MLDKIFSIKLLLLVSFVRKPDLNKHTTVLRTVR